MQKRSNTAVAFALLILLTVSAQCAPSSSPLDAYIQQPDASYAWQKDSETKLGQGVTRVRISMTSQTWHGIVWKHELDIFRPAKCRDCSSALLMIMGWSPDDELVKIVADATERLGMPFAVLFDVPNQPLFGQNEDGLISHTFVQCLETGDKTWPLLFPMTKSAVRAMDTVQKFAVSEWKSPVKGFVVTGASKRGWTTWLTGAVDKRVIGIAPAVYDNLNLTAQMRQQTACYGGYSSQIQEYTDNGLPQLLSTDKGREFAEIVDPYTFAKRLTMPKLLLLGSNDPYWTLESANLYYDDLPGDKHVYYAANRGHDMSGAQTRQALLTFAVLCSQSQKLPAVKWTYADKPDGLHLTMRPDKAASQVCVWTATSATRDFRKAKWTDQKISTSSGGAYEFTLAKPKTGCAAVFGEVSYPGDFAPLSQSTTPRILAAK